MSTAVVAAVFLTVSCVSFAVQLASLMRLCVLPSEYGPVRGAFYRGLLRTSICRVLAMAVNVAVGVVVVFLHAIPVATLIVFCAVQVMWLVNARLDVRLLRQTPPDRETPAR